MKILVTGSRDWPNERGDVIADALAKFPKGTILVHGACPTGADFIADIYGKTRQFEVRPYPADWESEGKAAGPKRNARMIREEHKRGEPIDLCIAFSDDLERSRGTRDCVMRARAAGIKTVVISGAPVRGAPKISAVLDDANFFKPDTPR